MFSVDSYRRPYSSLPCHARHHGLKQNIGSQKHEMKNATYSNTTIKHNNLSMPLDTTPLSDSSSSSFFTFADFAMILVLEAPVPGSAHFFSHSDTSFLARAPPQFLNLIVLLGNLFPRRLHKSGTSAPSCSLVLAFSAFPLHFSTLASQVLSPKTHQNTRVAH